MKSHIIKRKKQYEYYCSILLQTKEKNCCKCNNYTTLNNEWLKVVNLLLKILKTLQIIKCQTVMQEYFNHGYTPSWRLADHCSFNPILMLPLDFYPILRATPLCVVFYCTSHNQKPLFQTIAPLILILYYNSSFRPTLWLRLVKRQNQHPQIIFDCTVPI